MGKFKQFFKPDKPARVVTDKEYGEISDGGFTCYGGLNDRTGYTRFNPDSLLTKKGFDIYRKMLTDDQVKAVLRFKQYAIVSRNFFFDTTKAKPEDKDRQEELAGFFNFVVKEIEGQFTDKLVGILSGLREGFSVTEKVYSTVEYQGKTMWGIKALKLLPAHTFWQGFSTSPHGNLTGISQKLNGKEIDIPVNKVLHFVYQSDIDPHYGESDLRAAYRPYWSKDTVIRFQNIFLERHASGFVWAQTKGKLSSPQRSSLQNLLLNIQARMSAQVPESVDLKTIQPMRTDAFEKAIAQYDKAIAKAILVPNLLGITEQGTTGSYAQAQTQIDAFIWVLDHIANTLAELLNEKLFKELALWNFGAVVFPLFTWSPMSDVKKMELTKAWGEFISKGGAAKTDDDENFFRKMLGVPERSITSPSLDLKPAELKLGSIPSPPLGLKEDEKLFTQNSWIQRMNFSRIDKMLDKQDSSMGIALANTLSKTLDTIEKQIKKMVGQRSLGNVKPGELETVTLPKALSGQIKTAIKKELQAVLSSSYTQAAKELPVRKLSTSTSAMGTDQAAKYITVEAYATSAAIVGDLERAIVRVLMSAVRYDKTLPQTIAALRADTEIVGLLPKVDTLGRVINIPARLETIARTTVSTATNTARQAFFTSQENEKFVAAFEYSAILDDRTTDVCEALNGRIRKDWGTLTPPNHFNCRALLVPVTIVDDWDGKESKIPSKITPLKGFA